MQFLRLLKRPEYTGAYTGARCGWLRLSKTARETTGD
jgi:hypothetical protein